MHFLTGVCAIVGGVFTGNDFDIFGNDCCCFKSQDMHGKLKKAPGELKILDSAFSAQFFVKDQTDFEIIFIEELR